ncbi:MAG: replication-relaxation family protein [Pirellulales bacterium]|nr:replication-relaxation family protein [Pirellulales bacterium]
MKQQFQTIDARYNQLVYELNEPAKRVLQREGRLNDHAPRPGGPWLHRLMVSCITASSELAAEARPDLRYIPQHAILDRVGVGLGAFVACEHPVTGQTHSGDLIPDAICGLEYRNGKRLRRRFFLIEADRNTEPNRSGRFDRKSFRKSILQYREYAGGGLYKEHLKLDDPAAVLTLTTGARRMQNLVDLVAEIAPSGKNSFLCFQTAPAFGSPFKLPQPLPTLLTGPWARAGHAPAHIDRP